LVVTLGRLLVHTWLRRLLVHAWLRRLLVELLILIGVIHLGSLNNDNSLVNLEDLVKLVVEIRRTIGWLTLVKINVDSKANEGTGY
jgi:hypothetical protein